MSGAMKKVNKICQIVRLKQLVMRWKTMRLPCRTTFHHNSFSGHHLRRISPPLTAAPCVFHTFPPPSTAISDGWVACLEHRHSAAAHYSIALKLLKEEMPLWFGRGRVQSPPTIFPVKFRRWNGGDIVKLRCTGGLVLPCEIAFFTDIVNHIERDENKYRKLFLFLEGKIDNMPLK